MHLSSGQVFYHLDLRIWVSCLCYEHGFDGKTELGLQVQSPFPIVVVECSLAGPGVKEPKKMCSSRIESYVEREALRLFGL
ncbi:hypothetical protein F2Q70_00020899 [Brassica cretica]|uniref:Uncharacterized protein n=2 Tax=Brassica cretica TaxID=69181 RepID=A0A8S9GJ60_BRACR|nr:hypothetical protein F2Q70_00020899 [Brassica cretica]KAF2558786.1 hypothetical protein F2Q68_00014363 [Brassica cretica]KAF3610602.1 hypothetical protein DY000_02046838 [Brassica cretica]